MYWPGIVACSSPVAQGNFEFIFCFTTHFPTWYVSNNMDLESTSGETDTVIYIDLSVLMLGQKILNWVNIH